MKNFFVFLFIIASLTLSSCDSKDEDTQVPPLKTLKATIDGVEVTFDTFKVEKKDYIDGEGNPYSDLVVTATKTNGAVKSIIFNFEYLETGNNICYFFSLLKDEVFYIIDPQLNTSFIVSISENVANKIKGTFNGTIPEVEGIGTTVITNGSFEINY